MTALHIKPLIAISLFTTIYKHYSEFFLVIALLRQVLSPHNKTTFFPNNCNFWLLMVKPASTVTTII